MQEQQAKWEGKMLQARAKWLLPGSYGWLNQSIGVLPHLHLHLLDHNCHQH